jgi:DnaJ domain
MTAQAYPLQWPDNFPRSVARQKSAFKTSLSGALKNVQESLKRFGTDSGKPISNVVLSSNCSLGNSMPSDPGVAAWFSWDGDSVCIPVDRYAKPEENLQAIYHVIEARRTELRHGTLHLVKATMKGFKALPPPAGKKARRAWTEVLQLSANATKEQIEAAYRQAAKKAHPDSGGSSEAMQELNDAKREALA